MESGDTPVDSSVSGSSRIWLNILSVVLVSIVYIINLYHRGAVSWLWLFIGIVLCAIVFGPLASTRYGAWVGRWFRWIGIGGRLIALIAAAIVIWLFIGVFRPPMVSSISFVFGGLMGAVLVHIVEWYMDEDSNLSDIRL